MKSRLIQAGLVALLHVPQAIAGDAPDQLRNKTVVLSWREYRVQRSDHGEVDRSHITSVMIIYVSSAGRVFARLNRQGDNGLGNTTGHGPDGSERKSGQGASALNPAFEGLDLNVVTQMRTGARNVKATFNPGFTRCALKVIFGREDGQELYHRAMDGRMYHIVSTDVSGTNCTIRNGNAAAD